MEAVVIVAVIAAASGIVVGLFQLLGTKGSASNTFQQNLLTRVGQQDTKITQQGTQIDQLDDRVDQLEEWGKTTTDPVPRTPPPWRRRVAP